MAKVVDIEKAKVDRLATEMMPALRQGLAGPGFYMVRVDEIEDVERWRRAARKCARQLGVKVSTAISTDGETVWIVDRTPSTPAERGRAMLAISAVMRDLQRPE